MAVIVKDSPAFVAVVSQAKIMDAAGAVFKFAKIGWSQRQLDAVSAMSRAVNPYSMPGCEPELPSFGKNISARSVRLGMMDHAADCSAVFAVRSSRIAQP